MQRIVTTLFLAVLFVMTSQAQNVSEHTFANGIKGITFDSIKLHRYMQKDDGVRVFFVMKRTGTVQKVMGSVMSGGMDKVWLSALGVVDFLSDMKVVNEEVTFLKPDKAVFKKFNILDGNHKRITDAKVIATQDDCVNSNYDLYDKYPELKQKEEVVEVARPEMYYSNYINYAMMRGNPKEFVIEKNTLKEKDQQSEKGLWDALVSSNSKYEKEDKEIDMEGYRGFDKRDYWMRMSDPVCDPKTGVVNVHHGHINYKALGNRSNEIEQEVVTFDKDGKELNRTEMKFKVPHKLDLRQVLFTETPNNNLIHTDGIIHVYMQNYGMGYKKANPNPDKSARKYYQWDANGNVVADLEFKAPHEKASVVRAFHNGNNISLLAVTGYKEAAFYTTHFSEGKLTGSETFKESSPLAKGIGFSPSEIGGVNWDYHYSYNQKDGSKLVIYQLKKEVMEGQTKSIHSKGFVLFKIGQDGKITHAQHIKRSDKGNQRYKIKFKAYPSENGKYVAVVRDPLVGGTTAVDAYEIDGATLELKKILNLDNAADLSTKHLPKTNSMVFFSKDLEGNVYKMAKLGL